MAYVVACRKGRPYDDSIHYMKIACASTIVNWSIENNVSQSSISRLLDIDAPRVSNLFKMKLERFKVDYLLWMMAGLGISFDLYIHDESISDKGLA